MLSWLFSQITDFVTCRFRLTTDAGSDSLVRRGRRIATNRKRDKTMTKQKRKMQSVEPRFHQWGEIGDKVSGTLVDRQTFQYRNGNEGTRYILADDNGEMFQFNGTTQLSNLMDLIENGTYIEIEYIEDVETDQPQPAKIFDVKREIDG